MYRCRGTNQKHAGVAQLVEQRIRNAWVGSSTLSAGTNSLTIRSRVSPRWRFCASGAGGLTGQIDIEWGAVSCLVAGGFGVRVSLCYLMPADPDEA